MKLKCTLFIVLSLLFFLPGKAQTIKAALPVGINMTQVEGDLIHGYNKIGINAAIGAMIHLNEAETWEAGFEIGYHPMGSRSNRRDNLGNFKLDYQYISLPVFVNYVDVNKGLVGIGIMYNQLLREQETDPLGVVLDTEKAKDSDISFLAQIGYVFNPNFRFEIRFNYSIVPFNIDRTTQRTFHNVVTVRVNTILTALFKRR